MGSDLKEEGRIKESGPDERARMTLQKTHHYKQALILQRNSSPMLRCPQSLDH